MRSGTYESCFPNDDDSRQMAKPLHAVPRVFEAPHGGKSTVFHAERGSR